MRATRSGLALALAGVLSLAGCGSSGGDGAGGQPTGAPPPTSGSPVGGAGGTPDPCTLLTTDEVEAAAGGAVLSVVGPEDVLRGRQCEWTVPHDDFGEDVITLNVWAGSEFYAPDGPGADATGFVPIDGIGDVGHRWPNLMGLCGVIFMQGDVVVQLNLTGDDDTCVDLARAAASRL
jgi:hypothetical protein